MNNIDKYNQLSQNKKGSSNQIQQIKDIFTTQEQNIKDSFSDTVKNLAKNRYLEQSKINNSYKKALEDINYAKNYDYKSTVESLKKNKNDYLEILQKDKKDYFNDMLVATQFGSSLFSKIDKIQGYIDSFNSLLNLPSTIASGILQAKHKVREYGNSWSNLQNDVRSSIDKRKSYINSLSDLPNDITIDSYNSKQSNHK